MVDIWFSTENSSCVVMLMSSLCLPPGSMQVFLPPEGLTNFGEASPTQDNVFCAQLQRFQIKSMNERGLHSWHAENCYKKFPFLCKRSRSSRWLPVLTSLNGVVAATN